LASDEAALLTRQRVRHFQVGSSAAATLVTPVVWAEDLEGVEQNFVVALSEPLTDSGGEVVLPAGSEVVFALERVHESGLVLAQGISILADGTEQPLPEGAISLNGGGGSPLAAERIQVGEGEIASRDLKMALFGALGNLGSVLNRPDQENRFSSGTGGSYSETTVRNGDPNLVGALLEGGLSPMVEQLIARNEAQIEELQDRPGLWFLGAGREVEVFVNRSF
jgi:hypothetical protein